METNENPFSVQAIQVYAITVLFYSISYTLLMILPFYSVSYGASKTDVGMIMGATMFASMFFRPIAGKLIDAVGIKKVILVALFVFFISLPGYLVPNLFMFGMMRLVQGIVAAFFSTAMQIYTMEILSAKLRGQGLSLYSLSTMLPSTFGPALALYLKDIVPITSIFIFLICIGAVNFIFWIAIPVKSRKLPEKDMRLKPVSKKGLWKSRKLSVSSIIMLLVSISNGAIFTFLPLYLESNHLDYGKQYFLVQTIVLVLCRFLGRKNIPSDGRLPRRGIVVLILLTAVGTGLIALYTNLFILLIAAVLNGIAFSMLYPTLLTFISFSIPEQSERGFFIGLFISSADFGYALGAFAMGPIVDNTSYGLMYIMCSIISMFAITVSFCYRKE